MKEITLQLPPPGTPELKAVECFIRIYVLDHDGAALATIEVSQDYDDRADDLSITAQKWRDVGLDFKANRVSANEEWRRDVEEHAANLETA